jgi:CheY-like chemotaxis protein
VTVDCSANGQVEDLFVEADANQLQQAVVNLAINARDAQADAASIVFRLHREVLEAGKAAFPETVPPGDYVVVQVEDHGSGMTQEVLNQALDPFFTTKPVGQGTGLGLPVVFGIVRGHQGFLTIDSEPGRGTCIGIYLPRLADPAEHKAHFDFESGQVVEPEGIPGRTILVLDDEPAVRDVIRRFLEIAGHNVACAANSAEALEVLNNGMQIDLLILDLMMPREDGVSAFQLLRKLRPQLPVLLCTGLVAALPAQELVQASSVTVLRKPFRMNELWYAVNQALAAESALG